MIRFYCQDCGQRYKADESFAGEKIECNKCGAWVPVSSESMPQAISAPSTDAKKTQELKMPKLTMPSSASKKSTEPKETPELKMPKLSLPSSAEKTQAKKESGETEVPEVPKAPKLSMPVLGKEKKQETDFNLDNPEADCPNCGAALQSATAVICTNCGHNLKLGVNVNAIKNAKAAGKFGLAIAIGATAALLSGGIWAGIAIYFKLEIGWIACLIGLITGAAVCMVTPERSERIGMLAVALACVGLLTGKMLSAEYLVRDSFQGIAKMAQKITKFNGRFGKQMRDAAWLAMLKEEMQDNGEINDPYKNGKFKNAPKTGENSSKEYQEAREEASKQNKLNMIKVKKKFATLSKEDKARLQTRLERIILIIPLQQEMIDKGEISKPDDEWKNTAPKSFKEKPSKEYLKAFKKYSIQVAENMKKIKKKLYALSDAEAERLQGKIASSFSDKFSYWQKLKMIMSFWDILWFFLAFSTAWKLGSGNSIFSRQGI